MFPTRKLSVSPRLCPLFGQLGFFDPLGLLNNASEARFNRLREVELKHGRISVRAVQLHTLMTCIKTVESLC